MPVVLESKKSKENKGYGLLGKRKEVMERKSQLCDCGDRELNQRHLSTLRAAGPLF